MASNDYSKDWERYYIQRVNRGPSRHTCKHLAYFVWGMVAGIALTFLVIRVTR